MNEQPELHKMLCLKPGTLDGLSADDKLTAMERIAGIWNDSYDKMAARRIEKIHKALDWEQA